MGWWGGGVERETETETETEREREGERRYMCGRCVLHVSLSCLGSWQGINTHQVLIHPYRPQSIRQSFHRRRAYKHHVELLEAARVFGAHGRVHVADYHTDFRPAYHGLDGRVRGAVEDAVAVRLVMQELGGGRSSCGCWRGVVVSSHGGARLGSSTLPTHLSVLDVGRHVLLARKVEVVPVHLAQRGQRRAASMAHRCLEHRRELFF